VVVTINYHHIYRHKKSSIQLLSPLTTMTATESEAMLLSTTCSGSVAGPPTMSMMFNGIDYSAKDGGHVWRLVTLTMGVDFARYGMPHSEYYDDSQMTSSSQQGLVTVAIHTDTKQATLFNHRRRNIFVRLKSGEMIFSLPCRNFSNIITNNPSIYQKHPAVPAGSDSSYCTLYRQTEIYTLPITQMTVCVAY
jgi:hypothetical protein